MLADAKLSGLFVALKRSQVPLIAEGTLPMWRFLSECEIERRRLAVKERNRLADERYLRGSRRQVLRGGRSSPVLQRLRFPGRQRANHGLGGQAGSRLGGAPLFSVFAGGSA